MLNIKDLKVALDSDSGLVRAIDGLSLCIERGETFALVGESGCGKSMTALALMRLLPENGRVTQGRLDLGGDDVFGLPEARDARDPRRPHRHDLPGAGDQPEPGDAGRHADRRGDRGAHAAARAARACQGDRVAAPRRHSGARAAHRRVPVPPQRRTEAARDDRDDARRRARLPDRRRADHGTRRHDPGADPRSAEDAAARAGHGAAADHARPGRRLRHGGLGRADVCRPDHRGGASRRVLRRAEASLCAAAARGAARHHEARGDRSPRSPGPCRRCRSTFGGCRFTPRCDRAFEPCPNDAARSVRPGQPQRALPAVSRRRGS